MTIHSTDRPVRIRDQDGDQLVVALPHVDAVVAALERFHIEVTAQDPSEALGLALLELRASSAAPDGHAGGSSDPERPDGRGLSMPDLLGVLRDWFAIHHGGWVPTMGRNRIIDHVTGVGEISYGGKGDPVALSSKVSWGWRSPEPGHEVRVGVLDTRVFDAPWLVGGWEADDPAAVLQPAAAGSSSSAVDGHATFVTGLILSQAPGAVVTAFGVLNAAGQADCWSVAKAIAVAGAKELDVLNLSFVCFTEDGHPPLALATAISRVPSSTVIVAAAGNQGELDGIDGRRPAWPAALDGVVAVGATGPDGHRAPFSPDQPWVDCLAPGVDLVSTYVAGRVRILKADRRFTGFAKWEGTSFAAALVSGKIAAGVHPGRVDARTSWKTFLREATGEPPRTTGTPILPIKPPTTAGP